MPRLRRLLAACALAAASTVVAGHSAVAGQQFDGIDPVAVPLDQEPHHRVVFANEYVRIIDAVFPPLAVSQYHSHQYDNIAVTIRPGREDAQGQSRIGFAAFSRGGYSHVVTNPNTVPMRFIDVELLAPPPYTDRGEGLDDHELTLSTPRANVYRVRLAPGQRMAEHRHGAAYVSIVVRGPDAGTWRWHDADEASAPLVAGKQTLEIVEVEPR
ncbi:MAG: hypothetical protein AB7Q29_16730 [Vicinamibacterales bacterium]